MILMCFTVENYFWNMQIPNFYEKGSSSTFIQEKRFFK